jgi:hypothetical protein
MVTINKINRNGEIWRKLLNSVAGKYDCGVHFTNQSGEFGYTGDQACALEIVKETLSIFSGTAPLTGDGHQ